MHNKKLYRLTQLLFLICFLSYIVFIYYKATSFIDSDDASELLLARLISKENNYFTSNWFYSTELRIFSPQIIYAPIFKITNSFFKTRVLSSIVVMILLLISYYYLLKQFNIQRYFYLSSLVLLIPISEEYFNYVYKGLHYCFPIIVSFYTIGAIEKYIDKKNKLILLFPLLLCFISSLNSFKQLFYTFFPIFVVGMLFYLIKHNKETKEYLFITVPFLITSLIGYMINKFVLTKIFTFGDYSELKLDFIKIDKIKNTFLNFIRSYGSNDWSKSNTNTLYLIVSIILLLSLVLSILFILFTNFEMKEKRMALFVLISIGLLFGIYGITDIANFPRYNLPIIVFVLPLLAIVFNHLKNKDIFLCLIILCVIISSSIRYMNMFKKDNNYSEKDLVYKLTQNGYRNGYAGFWSGNILTELSNGELDVYIYKTDPAECTITGSVLDLDDWLQEKRHLEEKPKDKIFVLFDKRVEPEYAYFDFRSSEVFYNTNDFIVFSFNSYEELIKELERIKKE